MGTWKSFFIHIFCLCQVKRSYEHCTDCTHQCTNIMWFCHYGQIAIYPYWERIDHAVPTPVIISCVKKQISRFTAKGPFPCTNPHILLQSTTFIKAAATNCTTEGFSPVWILICCFRLFDSQLQRFRKVPHCKHSPWATCLPPALSWCFKYTIHFSGSDGSDTAGYWPHRV